MSNYKTTILKVAIHLETVSPIFAVSTVTIELEDEAAGIFLSIKDGEGGNVKVDIEQWDLLTKAVKELTAQKCEGMP